MQLVHGPGCPVCVHEEVRGACVANEGKLVAIVAPSAAQEALRALQGHPLGKDARIIGRVTAEHAAMLVLRTSLGTTHIVDMLAGDQLPGIC